MHYRVSVQRPDYPHETYYPDLKTAEIIKTHPWQCPTADITLTVGSRTTRESFISGMRHDNIIRIQCNENALIPGNQWRELFSGRITSIRGISESRGNEINVSAVGHGIELVNRVIKNDYNFTGENSGFVIKAMLGELSFIYDKYPSLIDTNSNPIANYNVNAYTKFFKDVVQFMEKSELYGYRFDTVPFYNENDKYIKSYATWQPVPETVTDKYRIFEGSRSYISSEFWVDVSNMVKTVTVFGNNESGVQYSAQVTGGMGDRDIVEEDLSIESNEMCLALAHSEFTINQYPTVTGTGRIKLTPAAMPGDLVQCNVSNMIIDGLSFNTALRVSRVQHSIGGNGAMTTLELGRYMPTFAEIIALLENQLVATKSNFIT